MLKPFMILMVFCSFSLTMIAADPPKVPEPVSVDSGDPVPFSVVVPEGAELGYQQAWLDDPKNKTMFDEMRPVGNTRKFFFMSKKPGVYPIVFWLKGETNGSVFVITVKGSVLPPRPPGPADQLAERIKTAYANAPGDSDRKTVARKCLISVFEMVGDSAPKSTIGSADALIKIGQATVTNMYNAAQLPVDTLTNVRQIIGDEAQKLCPSDSKFDKEVRDTMYNFYHNIARILKEIE